MPIRDMKTADDAFLVANDHLYAFDYALSLVEKQVKVLTEIVDACKIVLPEGEFVLVPQSRMKEIVETLDLHAGLMRIRVQKKVA